jgi:CRISPR-associated endonuclease/helicase Cas3
VTLRLALLREGVVVPYANDSDLRRAWSLSEVSVAKFRIAACPIPTGLEAVAAASLAGWGRWERESGRVLLAVMMPGESGYTFEAETESGQRVVVEYDRGAGLRWGSLAVAG